jgi:cap2 methyltransferase
MSTSLCKHPHCAQTGKALFAETPFTLILDHDSAPQMPYQPRKGTKSIEHDGQRKLMLIEMQALMTLQQDGEYLVVYAGAAPGFHIPALCKMFPCVKQFHLYDPRETAVPAHKDLKVFREKFDDSVARRYAGRSNVVFFCDVRNEVADDDQVPGKKLPKFPEERAVFQDMMAQKRWHEIMQPVISVLKFRPPWPDTGVLPDNTFRYLDGDIYLPVWGPQSTTECRLMIVNGVHHGERDYDIKTYEGQLYRHNNDVRPRIHSGHLQRNGYDGCFDCTAEVQIFRKYLQLQGKEGTEEQILEHSKFVSYQIKLTKFHFSGHGPVRPVPHVKPVSVPVQKPVSASIQEPKPTTVKLIDIPDRVPPLLESSAKNEKPKPVAQPIRVKMINIPDRVRG